MCGICGVITLKNKIKGERLQKMSDTIAHRGPDGEGYWINKEGTVGLGHRRLSIIDLSDAGNQPMKYLDRYILIFNGEIYNYLELKERLVIKGYCFHSHSDTEVLMALYDQHKEGCLQYLDGMFSFVLFDEKEKILFCARDRFGEKPFYYHYKEGNEFYFASEMKALWAAGIQRQVNERMLFNYLAYGQLQNPEDLSETFYSGILKLEAAHFLKIDTSTVRVIDKRRYWNLSAEESENVSLETVREKFKELFLTSVKRRLRSDVPVGSSLSGGLDSSLVVMTIDELKKGTGQLQKTFSARFPGYLKDEGAYMQLVIDQCKVEPHFTFPTGESLLKNIEKVFYHQEEPFGSASICAQYEVMKLAKGNNVTVLLDGQGADEILAGYHNYFPVFFKELKKIDYRLYQNEASAYFNTHKNSAVNPVIKKNLKTVLRNYVGGPYKLAKKVKQYYQQSFSPEFNSDFYHANKKQVYPFKPVFSSLNNSLLWDTTVVGLEQLLRYADRNSMAHSVEVRLPFLSHELVEFMFTLPANFKIKDGWTKWIMRQTFKNFLPDEIVWRKDKIGYEPPQQSWMENKGMREILYCNRKLLIEKGVLNKSIITMHGSDKKRKIENNLWTHLMAGFLFSDGQVL